MGSFGGHIDEGVVFIILALWWIYNMAKSYVQCLEEHRSYRSNLSYPCTIRGRKVPLEICLKIGFPVFGFIAECANNKLHFVEEDGEFHHQSSMQHMTIYFMFAVHGITDLIDYLDRTAMKDMKYITCALSFIVYGTGFYYHSEPSTNKSPLETMVHRLPVYVMFVTALALFIEIFKRDSVVIQIIRCHAVLTFGTWFSYVAFVLFDIAELTTSHKNKAWDQYDMKNVHFMVTAYVSHMIGNSLVIMAAFYFAESYRKCLRFVPILRDRFDVKYEKAPLIDVDDPEFGEDAI